MRLAVLWVLPRNRSHSAFVELHLVGHSASAILHDPLVQYLTGKGVIGDGPMARAKVKGLRMRIDTCTLWAPACTTQLFKESYLPAIKGGQIERFAMFALTDQVEQDDDCASIYQKSLLYLVSNAFEKTARIRLIRPDGEPILGMEKFVDADTEINTLFKDGKADWVRSPNTDSPGSTKASRAIHHGDFDNDEATVKATLARILDKTSAKSEVAFSRTAM